MLARVCATCHTPHMTELGALIGGVLAGFLPGQIGSRAADRRRLAQGRVRCALRAEEGRVAGIGREWSGGTAELQPGRMTFRPEIGVVGDREIPVRAVRAADLPARERPNLAAADAAILAVETDGGTLLWAVPARLAERIRDLVG